MARLQFSFSFSLLCLLLSACGGGNGNKATNPGPTAPSSLSYPAPPALVVGQPMTALSPSVTGAVTSYAVSPALPAGIALSAATGIISGTPTAVQPASAYTVTVSNSSGSTTATVSITVNDAAPAVSYNTTNVSFVTGVPTALTPVNTGGTPTSWAIEPALPAGLTFNVTDGRIGGTPTQSAVPAQYVVVASNSGGQSQVTLTIAVESGVLVKLGHADELVSIRMSETRALTQDIEGRWTLWNSATGAIIADGAAPCSRRDPLTQECLGYFPVDLGGSTFAIQTETGLQVRSASDGQALSTLATAVSSWRIATDGSSINVAKPAGFTSWSPSGAVLFERSGDYSHASIFATGAEVRIGGGGAGSNLVETVALPSGTSTLSATFLGDFHSWFTDGESFLTSVGTSVRVYSKHVTPITGVISLAGIDGLTGQGSWFWFIRNGVVNLYAADGSSAPTATFGYGVSTRAIGSGTKLAVLPYGEKRMTLVDLSSNTHTSSEISVPRPYLVAFGAAPTGEWLLGTREGVLFEGADLPTTTKYLGYGKARSIVGADSRIAIATASGKILTFDAQTKEAEDVISFPGVSHVEISIDGTVLTAAAEHYDAQYDEERSIKIYEVPNANLTHTWPYTYPTGPYLYRMAVSASGNVLAQTLIDGSQFTRQVTPATGGGVIWSETRSFSSVLQFMPIRLSPDGARFATPTGERSELVATNIFTNGVLSGAARGFINGWLDDDRLLTSAYAFNTVTNKLEYTAGIVSDADGAELAELPLPELKDIQPVSASSIYSPDRNAIYSLTDGARVWNTPSPARGVGAVAGPYVVFASGAEVRAERY